MYHLFFSPPATGKTTNAEKLRQALGMDMVVEMEELKNMSRASRLRTHTSRKVLVLGTGEEDRKELSGFARVQLSREACNMAMCFATGRPIWNEDGTLHRESK